MGNIIYYLYSFGLKSQKPSTGRFVPIFLPRLSFARPKSNETNEPNQHETSLQCFGLLPPLTPLPLQFITQTCRNCFFKATLQDKRAKQKQGITVIPIIGKSKKWLLILR